MSLSISRRKRRRRLYRIPIIIIILVLIVLLVLYIYGSCGRESKKNVEPIRDGTSALYGEFVTELVKKSNDTAASFMQLRERTRELSRAELEMKLNEMATASDEINKEAALNVPPQKMMKAHAFLQICLDLRAGAIKDYKLALFNALEDKDIEISTSQMSTALMNFYLSDIMFQHFFDEFNLVISNEENSGIEIPTSSFLNNQPLYETASIVEFINSLKTVETLQPEHGVALDSKTVIFSPVPKGEQEGYILFSYTENISMTITVENQGNQIESNVPFVVTLKSELDPNPKQKMITIKIVNPGEKIPVSISDVPTFPGARCLLTLKVGPVIGEKYEGNNIAEFKILVEGQ